MTWLFVSGLKAVCKESLKAHSKISYIREMALLQVLMSSFVSEILMGS